MTDWETIFPPLKKIFIFQLFCTVCLLLVLFKYPILILKVWQRYLIFKTGFSLRKCRVSDNFEFEYIERGNKDEQEISVLLIHGFSSSKDNWCMMASYIPKRIHVIALDLPGHGGTTRKEKDDLSVHGFVKRVEQFVEAVGLNKKKYHLMGTSFGGCIAGVHTAMFPDHILSSMLVCPAGLDTPVKSEMILAYENHSKIKLLPKNEDEFDEMIAMLVHKPVKIPRIIVTGIMQARRKAHSFLMKLLEEIISDENKFILEEHLPEINTNVLVVWGKHDNALDVCGAEIIRKKLPSCRVEILEECGHSIALERPRKLARILTSFVDESHSG
eukprot:gene4850-5486_t